MTTRRRLRKAPRQTSIGERGEAEPTGSDRTSNRGEATDAICRATADGGTDGASALQARLVVVWGRTSEVLSAFESSSVLI
jgi:hypothetical protein